MLVYVVTYTVKSLYGNELTMTVNGEVYMMILKTIATIPISMDLSLVPWRNVSVTKMRIAMKIASIIKAIMIFCCRYVVPMC